MKTILFWGDNTSKMFSTYLKFKDDLKMKGYKSLKVLGKDLAEVISLESLFDEQKLIVVENPELISINDINFIEKVKQKGNLILLFYLEKNSLPKNLKNFSFDEVYEFKIPKLIWKFLDSFIKGNKKNCLMLFHAVLKKETVNLIFYLLSKRIIDLYWLEKTESLSYPPWRIANLKKQRKTFNFENLERMIEELCILDINSKTISEFDLVSQLDLFIAKNLE